MTFGDWLRTLRLARTGKRIRLVPIPIKAALLACDATRLIPFFPTVSRERVLGLAGAAVMDSAADLAALGIVPRDPFDALAATPAGRRRLIGDAATMLDYISGRRIRSFAALSRLTRALAHDPASRFALPGLTQRWPALLRLFEPIRPSMVHGLSRRLHLAAMVAETTPAQQPRPVSPLYSCKGCSKQWLCRFASCSAGVAHDAIRRRCHRYRQRACWRLCVVSAGRSRPARFDDRWRGSGSDRGRFRVGPRAWRRIGGPTADDGLSPKLRTPAARAVVDPFRRDSNFVEDNFYAIGARARGGLSRIWGGFVAELDDADMQDWPFKAEALRDSYRRVMSRVGVSGSSDDDMASFFGKSAPLLEPPKIGPTAQLLLDTFLKSPSSPGFSIGPGTQRPAHR